MDKKWLREKKTGDDTWAAMSFDPRCRSGMQEIGLHLVADKKHQALSTVAIYSNRSGLHSESLCAKAHTEHHELSNISLKQELGTLLKLWNM